MSITLVELEEKLKDIDEITLLETLNITSEELVDRFEDRIEDSFESLAKDFELAKDNNDEE